MEFSPQNNIVKLCLQGISLEEKGEPEKAAGIFRQAWEEAAEDFEKFLAAYFAARHQETVSDKLKWFETLLQYALKINDESVRSAFPSLYFNIAKCYEESGDTDKAKMYYESAASLGDKPTDKGPFYHGTKADLQIGALLKAGGSSNYRSDLKMNHIYFTALVSGAGLAAEMAKGEGRERVYIVEPTGDFEHDPNVTDKKFPGNMTRSYRSAAPLKIIGEVKDWARQSPEELKKWKEKVAKNKGDIIN